ncbi:MAG: hypothetical protein EOP54_18895 [Sphingobacteriales bacterium]|nr:MAG: hypothetical protein EOP54_18895 [Sphingobacteriales bacterium]
MKQIKLLSIFLILFSAILFTSCDSESIDPELSGVDDGGDNGGIDNGGGNGNGGNNGSTSGDYWPMALNNKWVFNSNGMEEEMKITGTQTVEGTSYYKVNQLFSSAGVVGNATTLLRKNNGSYAVRIGVVIPGTQGGPTITISPYEFIILKDNLAVGQTWTQNVTQTTSYSIPGIPPIEMVVNYTGTIVEKDATITVNGETYTNVIKSKLVQTYTGGAMTTNYWFAKNTGPVKAESTTTGGVNSTLVSYDVN